MKGYDLLLLANKNLWRRRGRTILTVLGMLIGTTSIVVMLSLGIGLVESQKEAMAQWGSLNIITVNEAHEFPGDPEGGGQKRLTESAIVELRSMEGVIGVSPAFRVWGEARFGRKRGGISLVGIDPREMERLEFGVSDGRLLTASDRFNVLAGSQVINQFWDERAQPDPFQEMPSGDPLELLGQRLQLTVHNQQQPQPQKRLYNLTVVGILDEKAAERAGEVYGPLSEIRRIRDFMNEGRQAVPGRPEIPVLTPAEREMKGRIAVGSRSPDRQEEQYSFALVQTKDVAHTRRLSEELREMGYSAWSIADNLEGIERTARVMQAILGGIGAIALLVAAIGIANTMVMSIYERTREVAIMKVIGASFADIRTLFLAESALIGFLGGTFGLALSYALSYGLNEYAVQFIFPEGAMMADQAALRISLIPPWLAGFAVAFSISTGLLAGIYPANRAIRLDPVAAMRHL